MTSAVVRALRRYGFRLYSRAHSLNTENIANVLRKAGSDVRICDLGGGDGVTTSRLICAGRATDVTLVEYYHPFAVAAHGRGHNTVEARVDVSFPFLSSSFDVVTSNQVIEHLHDTDLFLAESYRILKPGGRLIVSTENLASWHNVAALIFGWQAFSLTNVSNRRAGLGNPLAYFAGEADVPIAGMQHWRVFSAKALRSLLEAHGFVNVRLLGAGYHPLPPELGRFDPLHAHFITAFARKPGF